MQDKLQALVDKLNEWGARLADTVSAAFAPRPKPVPVRIKVDPRHHRLVMAALGGALVFSMASAPLQAAPAKKKPVTTANAKSGLGAKPAAPARKPSKTPIPLGERFMSTDLERIFVGNQAGILKVYNASKVVVFKKDAAGTDMEGVDGIQWAPLADKHRTAILGALNIGDGEVASVSAKVISNYRSLPQGRNAVALLGLIGSIPGQRLPAASGTQIRQFLSGLLASEKDVSVRRQAVLALALCADTDESTVRSVITFMTASHNAWETFTTRQFFEYHRDEIRAMSSAVEIKRLLGTSGNPYSADIVSLLN
jgi:hypothetical protein